MLGKKSSEKSEKNFFYIHTNIVTKKWGGKNAQKNFSINTRKVQAKNVGEKIVGKKVQKNIFLNLHEYRDQKIGGTKRAKQFFQKH